VSAFYTKRTLTDGILKQKKKPKERAGNRVSDMEASELSYSS